MVPFGSAEESVKQDKGDTADIKVYTDGSGFKGKAGAAAVLYRGGMAPKSLRYCLGTLNEHTSFEA